MTITDNHIDNSLSIFEMFLITNYWHQKMTEWMGAVMYRQDSTQIRNRKMEKLNQMRESKK